LAPRSGGQHQAHEECIHGRQPSHPAASLQA
jgi:hypothetical protein